MLDYKTQQKSSRTIIQLCSRCLANEINNWVNDKWKELSEEAKKQIHQELKTIKLSSGSCIVCENSLVSDGTSERILEMLKNCEVPEKTTKEFKRFFVL